MEMKSRKHFSHVDRNKLFSLNQSTLGQARRYRKQRQCHAVVAAAGELSRSPLSQEIGEERTQPGITTPGLALAA